MLPAWLTFQSSAPVFPCYSDFCLVTLVLEALTLGARYLLALSFLPSFLPPVILNFRRVRGPLNLTHFAMSLAPWHLIGTLITQLLWA